DVGRGGGRGARQARAQCAALGLQTPQARAEEARAEADQTHRYSSCFNRPTPHARQGQGDTLKGLVAGSYLIIRSSRSIHLIHPSEQASRPGSSRSACRAGRAARVLLSGRGASFVGQGAARTEWWVAPIGNRAAQATLARSGT